MPSLYEKLLSCAIPQNSRLVLSGAISRAYAVCDKYQKEIPELSACIGYDARPHLRRVIVDYCLQSSAGAANLTATVDWNQAKNCRHVRLYGKQIVLTANAVDSLSHTPRDALFRKKLTKSLNLSLFPDDSSSENIIDINRTYFAHIVHGGNGKEPDFIGLQVPSHDGSSLLHVEAMQLVKTNIEAPVEEIDDNLIERLLRDKKDDEEHGAV